MLSNTCPHCGKDMGANAVCPHCEHRREAADEQTAKKSSGCLTLLIILLCFIVGAAFILVPNYLRARGDGHFTACQSNLKDIGTALERYATDHNRHYPKTLADLTPAYIQEIPTCPASGSDSYSASYVSSYNAYTFYCKGRNHTQSTDSDFPEYNSNEGLVVCP